MTSNKTFNIGIIIGSTRVRRVGPQVANFIRDSINNAGLDVCSDASLRLRTVIDLIDLKDHNLPIFDEPGIPNRITSPDGYLHEHTRRWARRVASYDGFIFVSAQRNWGIPAELKNAIDYLFHEWKGKPALVVSYGGHGGVQCAEQIRTVLGAIGMRVVGQMVHMKFPSHEYLERGFKGEDLRLDASSDAAPWAKHRSEIAALFWDEIIAKMLVKA